MNSAFHSEILKNTVAVNVLIKSQDRVCTERIPGASEVSLK